MAASHNIKVRITKFFHSCVKSPQLNLEFKFCDMVIIKILPLKVCFISCKIIGHKLLPNESSTLRCAAAGLCKQLQQASRAHTRKQRGRATCVVRLEKFKLKIVEKNNF